MIARKNLTWLVIIAFIVILAFQSLVLAEGLQRYSDQTFSFGLQFTFPYWGVSVVYDFTDRIAVQAVTSFGLGPDLISTPLFVKGMYRLSDISHWSEHVRTPKGILRPVIYGFGGLGWVRVLESIHYRARYSSLTGWEERTWREYKSSPGVSFGIGIDYDMRILELRIPRILLNSEIGYSFSPRITGGSSLLCGVGIHYRF